MLRPSAPVRNGRCAGEWVIGSRELKLSLLRIAGDRSCAQHLYIVQVVQLGLSHAGYPRILLSPMAIGASRPGAFPFLNVEPSSMAESASTAMRQLRIVAVFGVERVELKPCAMDC